MKICFISPSKTGGISTYIKRIVDNLIKNKIDVKIIPFNNNSDIKKIYSELKIIKPDIIRLEYTLSIYGIYSLLLFRILKKFKGENKTKIVVNFHEVKRETDFLGIFGKIYYNLISKLFDKIYVHTNEAREILINKCKVSSEKIKVIHHGTYEFKDKKDLSKEIRKKYNLDKENIILFFGFIHIDKGIEYLLNAGKGLFKNNPELKKNTQIVIAGDVRARKGIFKIFGYWDEKYLKNLLKLKDSLNLKENVKFIGSVEDKEIYSLINLSKIMVLPYTNAEQSGILNLALAVHKPMIASNIGGLKETLKDIGVLVSPKNSREIEKEIKKLFEDKKYYNSIVQGYKKIEEEQNTAKINKLIVKEFRELIK